MDKKPNSSRNIQKNHIKTLCLLVQNTTSLTPILFVMKKIALFLFAAVLFSGFSFAQTQKAAVWPEMKAFHELMSASFHPAEEGNFAPLKENAPKLYRASKVWYASEIPANFKAEETKAALDKLMKQCNQIWREIENKASDEQLKTLITEAHDTFHKIVGECKK